MVLTSSQYCHRFFLKPRGGLVVVKYIKSKMWRNTVGIALKHNTTIIGAVIITIFNHIRKNIDCSFQRYMDKFANSNRKINS